MAQRPKVINTLSSQQARKEKSAGPDRLGPTIQDECIRMPEAPRALARPADD
jgi:hypothetical protein